MEPRLPVGLEGFNSVRSFREVVQHGSLPRHSLHRQSLSRVPLRSSGVPSLQRHAVDEVVA